LENAPGSLQSRIPGSNSQTWGRFYDVLGSNIVVQYPVGPITTLHGQIAAREYVDRLGNQVHPMIRTLSLNNDEVLQDDNVPIHTTGTVQSWFEEYEGELQHIPWLAQSLDLNVIETLWSVLETRVRNRFPPPTILKRLEDVFKKNGIKFHYRLSKTCMSPFEEGLRLY
jgi:hypothetical protein